MTRGVPPRRERAEQREHLRGVTAAAQDDRRPQRWAVKGATGRGRERDVQDAEREDRDEDRDEKVRGRLGGHTQRPRGLHHLRPAHRRLRPAPVTNSGTGRASKRNNGGDSD